MVLVIGPHKILSHLTMALSNLWGERLRGGLVLRHKTMFIVMFYRKIVFKASPF